VCEQSVRSIPLRRTTCHPRYKKPSSQPSCSFSFTFFLSAQRTPIRSERDPIAPCHDTRTLTHRVPVQLILSGAIAPPYNTPSGTSATRLLCRTNQDSHDSRLVQSMASTDFWLLDRPTYGVHRILTFASLSLSLLVPHCCIYGYQLPGPLLSDSVQDTLEDHAVTLYYVAFASTDVKDTSSPRTETARIVFEKQADVQRFLALAKQFEGTLQPQPTLPFLIYWNGNVEKITN